MTFVDLDRSFIRIEKDRGKDKEPTRFWQIYFGGESLWQLSAPDLPWLYDDLSALAHEGDRRVALSAIVSILTHEEQLHDEVEPLRARIASNASLVSSLISNESLVSICTTETARPHPRSNRYSAAFSRH